jgi:flagellar capping protein FliD
MKIIFYIAISLLTIQVYAQTTIKPFDAKIDYGKAQRPCLQVNLDPEPKTLKKAWREYLKDNYDFKLKGIGFLSNKDLLSAEEINVNQISSKVMDFYTHIVEDENGSEMKVFVRHGYDIYVSEENYPNEYFAVREILESFIKYYLPKYYEERLSDTEKRVKELVKESDDLQEEIEDDSDDIAKLKKEIEEKEEKLKSNKQALETAKAKLTKRQEKLKRIRSKLRKL